MVAAPQSNSLPRADAERVVALASLIVRAGEKDWLRPTLNDGVAVIAALLHELMPWKERRAYWNDLLAGKYAWSTIAKRLRARGVIASD